MSYTWNVFSSGLVFQLYFPETIIASRLYGELPRSNPMHALVVISAQSPVLGRSENRCPVVRFFFSSVCFSFAGCSCAAASSGNRIAKIAMLLLSLFFIRKFFNSIGKEESTSFPISDRKYFLFFYGVRAKQKFALSPIVYYYLRRF